MPCLLVLHQESGPGLLCWSPLGAPRLNVYFLQLLCEPTCKRLSPWLPRLLLPRLLLYILTVSFRVPTRTYGIRPDARILVFSSSTYTWHNG